VKIRLKPLRDQVVVVAGASSGIGRASALKLAGRGAKVVVAARSEEGLTSLVAEIIAQGGTAAYAVCDVADFAQVQQVADFAVRTYGRIDTWVNCAAVSVFATFEDTTPEEFRRLMEVNYLGQMHGALAALPHLRQAGQGAIIAISSVESIVSLPLHAAYSASKHAVEGAMDALRRDLIADGAPISVTSVKPATINTPFFTNSRNKMDVKPKGPPPLYSPSVVAACVVYAAEHPVRDLFAGGAGKQMALSQFLAPRFTDAAMGKATIRSESTRQPMPGGSPGNLDRASDDDRTDGDFRGRPSLYTFLQLHPRLRRLAGVSAVASAPMVVNALRRR
jgi:NAD(P)-dependent dehydrogenase (short-subunit alcohol dehydrogenase family)